MKPPARHRAVALPLVLWAVFIMTTVLVVTIGLVDFDLELESLAAKRFEARQLALTGLAYASHPQIERGDPLLKQEFPNGTRLEVALLSEDARLNINKLLESGDLTPLTQLFRFWGASDKEATLAVDSLRDWVDKDEFRGLNGAESADLPPDSPYSRPENRPFLNIAEMGRVRGMDTISRVNPNWKDVFSVRSSNQLDLQDVSSDLLQVFGGLSPDQAKTLIDFRRGPDDELYTEDDPKIDSPQALAAVVSLTAAQLQLMESRFGGSSQMRRIVSRGYCGGRLHQITAITNGVEGKGYLEWVEN